MVSQPWAFHLTSPSAPAHYVTADSIYEDAQQDADRIVRSLRPSEHDEAIVQAGEEDQAKGFCGPPLTWAQLCQELPKFRLIRRFCIKQSLASFASLMMLRMEARAPSVPMRKSLTFAQAFSLAYMFNFYGKPHLHPRARRNYPTPTDTFQRGRTTAIWLSWHTMTTMPEPPVFDGTVRASQCCVLLQQIPSILSSSLSSPGLLHDQYVLRRPDHPGL